MNKGYNHGELKGGASGNLDTSTSLWDTFTLDQKIKHIHDNVVIIRKEIDLKPPICTQGQFVEARVTKLEKSKKWKNLYALLGGIIGGYGSKHLP